MVCYNRNRPACRMPTLAITQNIKTSDFHWFATAVSIGTFSDDQRWPVHVEIFTIHSYANWTENVHCLLSYTNLIRFSGFSEDVRHNVKF